MPSHEGSSNPNRAGLQSEALAFVDLLVLVRARQFVGCLLGTALRSTSMPAVSLNKWMDLSVTSVLSDHDVSCPAPRPRAAYRYPKPP